MFIVVAKKKLVGLTRGFEKKNDFRVVSVYDHLKEVYGSDENALAFTLNDLQAEHDIIQILWKN